MVFIGVGSTSRHAPSSGPSAAADDRGATPRRRRIHHGISVW
jgi:hypothetical protein